MFNWVLSNPSNNATYGWQMAPLLSGVLAYGECTGNQQAIHWVRDMGESIGYSMGLRPSMADDVAVGQAFLRLYQLDGDPRQLADVKAWIDGFVAMPHERSLEWKDQVYMEEMAWCDALYMAPPTMALLAEVTGQREYLDAMSRLWWKASGYLYDSVERLYFRDSRYFTQREANGEKVFWSRGNGWVLAGLARVHSHMPSDYPGRARFVAQFREMAARIASLQTEDGTWHASLLDPDAYPVPETSGTGFFTNALAWGVNEGLLDRERFEPVILDGFAALCEALDPNGKLGYVQPVGADPRAVMPWDTDTYGVGAILLAACEVDEMRADSANG